MSITCSILVPKKLYTIVHWTFICRRFNFQFAGTCYVSNNIYHGWVGG